ncbi:MAG TPA: iron-sulfur cluster repair di-iron protein [Armatimonadota bacterium]|nr:iron-sulfur cluster repair di-iron protein [Armatimonadota bacterium]
MNEIELTKPLGQLVAENPARARVFDQHGIDYCCGGKKRLFQACAEKSLDPAAVIAELHVADHVLDPEDAQRWSNMSIAELVDHIESTHHFYLRNELPRLSYLIEKVVSANADRHPELYEIASVFSQFRAEAEVHLHDEETIMFPLCRELENPHPRLRRRSGTIRTLFNSMEDDHSAQAADLAELKRLTNNFTAPTDACDSYRVMLDTLAHVVSDTYQHVHKENNILFPRAAALESSRSASHEEVMS